MVLPMMAERRNESEKLKLFRSLNNRMTLSPKERNNYLNMEKGLEGEKKFDAILEKQLESDFLILPDLLYDYNTSIFQIDTFVISRLKHFLFEIKNSEGDFFIDKGKWYHISGEEIADPLSQLKRSKMLLSRLFKEHGYNIPFEAFVIFVNPDFSLLQAPIDSPIILPGQINHFLKNMNLGPHKLTQQQQQLSAKMLSWRTYAPPYKYVPHYTYDGVRKGIACEICHTFYNASHSKMFNCHNCRHLESVTSAVLRTIDEFVLMYPELEITTNGVYEWCGGVVSKKGIRNILLRYFRLIGHASSSHYVKSN